MKRKRWYHVRPLANGRWAIGFDGARRPSASADSGTAAIRRAQQLARLAGSDLIVIYAPDGSSQEIAIELTELSQQFES